jgi:hypothetical protein
MAAAGPLGRSAFTIIRTSHTLGCVLLITFVAVAGKRRQDSPHRPAAGCRVDDLFMSVGSGSGSI